MTKNIILDSCVFNKLYLDEKDRDLFLQFLNEIANQDVQLLAPSIFTYEVLAVASSNAFGAKKAYELISEFEETGFQLIEMNSIIVNGAIKIADTGHPKSGYPTFYDSAYHALAIETKGVFLTSDHRHYAKVKDLGNIELLENWENLFE